VNDVVEIHPRESWAPDLLAELHTLAIGMSSEPREHFDRHAHTNDSVHLFRAQDGQLVGFQFWRALSLPEARVVVGGKLRIAAAYRRRGLHLRSGLAFYREQLAEHPHVVRVSLASIFGFVSITRALVHYDILNEKIGPAWLCHAVDMLARESHFTYERATGLVRVGIQITAQQLASYPEAFFEGPAASVYAQYNPDYRHNGTYLAFGFALSNENLNAIERAVALKSRLAP
jgi:hypothetical protein